VRFPDVIIAVLLDNSNVRATEKDRTGTVRRPKERRNNGLRLMGSLSENVRISVTISTDGQILETELESKRIIKNIITQYRRRNDNDNYRSDMKRMIIIRQRVKQRRIIL